MAGIYDYVSIELGAGPAGALQRQLAAQTATRAGDLGQDAEALALFAPQLGWRARQAAALVRSPGGAPLDRLFGDAPVASWTAERVTPTLRPQGEARPKPGGVYVHRWFTLRAPDQAEFVDLSGQGWADFEQHFDAQIYGLFQAAPTPEDADAGVVRLLLLTRYGDHAVWEASRDPTTAAMQIFIRRQSLTLDTVAASTLMVPPAAA